MTGAVQPDPPRRDFLKRLSTAVMGTFLALCPTVAGLIFVADPLRRRSAPSQAVKIATLTSLPADGVPRKFSVVADRSEAWNKFPEVPIGAVYLRRTGEKEVQALNVVCPHLGCFVEFLKDKKAYHCPCHNSSFALDGRVLDPSSPSPRALDSLVVEIREGQEVWVHFQNFQTGQASKIPVR